MCSYSLKVSPHMNSRLVDSAKGVLNKFLPDVYIYADHVKGNRTSTYVCICQDQHRLIKCQCSSLPVGRTGGYGIILVSESTTGVTHCAEVSSAAFTGKGGAVLPEDLGKNAAHLLLDEIAMVI